jgi:HEAT repeat protein
MRRLLLTTVGLLALTACPLASTASGPVPSDSADERVPPRDKPLLDPAARVEDIPALLRAVQDGSKKERLAAIRALASLGPKADDAVPELWAAAKDRDREIADCALGALMKIREPVPLLLKAFLSDDEGLSWRADWTLQHLGPAEAAEFMPPLVRHLRERGPHQRQVIYLVSHFPAYGLGAVPTLIDVLKTPLPEPRTSGAEIGLRLSVSAALSKIGRPAVLPVVRSLPEMDRRGRFFAAWAFADLGQEAADAVPALLVMLCRDPYPRNREAAWDALARIGKAGVPQLVRALDDKDPAIRRAALFILAYLGSDARLAVSQLVDRLGRGDPEMRGLVAETLRAISVDQMPPTAPLTYKLPLQQLRPTLQID